MKEKDGAFHAPLDEMPTKQRFKNSTLGLVAIGALLTGCSPPSYPLVGADPADASARVAAVGYQSIINPYVSLRPTTPKAWREQNDRAGSAPKSGQ